VFILGAGASREGNCPVMADFLSRTRDLSASGKLSDIHSEVTLLERVRSQLQRGFAKGALDIDNIESVFSAVEMAKTLGVLGDLESQELDSASAAVSAAIVRTIEESQRFRYEINRLVAPAGYKSLARVIKQQVSDKRSVSILTFNYDVGIDIGLLNEGMTIDYAVETVHADLTTPLNVSSASIKLLKLHGSVNWAWGSLPQAFVRAVNLGSLHIARPFEDSDNIKVPVWSQILRRQLSKAMNQWPFIVPPTDAKASMRMLVQPVWKNAAAELADARVIVVIGFSWPTTDEFFRYLWTIGSISDNVLESFLVVNPDAAIEHRFASLVGGAVRRCMRFYPQKMNDSLGWISTMLKRENS